MIKEKSKKKKKKKEKHKTSRAQTCNRKKHNTKEMRMQQSCQMPIIFFLNATGHPNCKPLKYCCLILKRMKDQIESNITMRRFMRLGTCHDFQSIVNAIMF